MGIYHKVLNLDKMERLSPHRFGDSSTFLSFACSGGGMLTGLAFLLKRFDGLPEHQGMRGRWAGDRIYICSDAAHDCDEQYSSDAFVDISDAVVDTMLEDDEFIVGGTLRDKKSVLQLRADEAHKKGSS